MIIGTTSMKSILQEMELVDCFNTCMTIPNLKLKSEINEVLSRYNSTGEVITRISEDVAN